MKKSIFLFLTVCLFSAAAQAQQVKFGLKGGLTVSKLTNLDDVKSRASIYAGAFARVGLTESWSIQPELVYSGQGYKGSAFFLGDYNVAVNYINLPVMAQYHIVPEFYLEAGPQLGFRVSSKAKRDGSTLNVGDAHKGVDFGLGFGLGYDFDFGLGVGARYNFGLTNVVDESNESYKNSVAQFGVTYTFGNFRIKR